MPYYLDFARLNLDFLAQRLVSEDLIPSQIPLREESPLYLPLFKASGINTLDELFTRLQKKEDVASLGIPVSYCTLLLRALRGYRPRKTKLKEYLDINAPTVAALSTLGIDDSYALWEAAHTHDTRKLVAESIGISQSDLLPLLCMADLSRIQWVSPLFARLLYDAGFPTSAHVATARAEDLVEQVAKKNTESNRFKGKIGIRDMRRLVYCASLLPHELEY